MDGLANHGEGDSQCIWLRYATQFTVNGRTHTIEMALPIPVGASNELREQLLREAEAGMNMLTSHVDRRVSQMTQRPPSGNVAPATKILPQQVTPDSTTATPPPQQTAQVRERSPEVAPTAPKEVKEVVVPPTRPSVGASMPSTPTTTHETSSMTIPEFLHHIKEELGLESKQAMNILNVRSLSGINLRAALLQLQKMTAQGNTGPTEQPNRSSTNTNKTTAVPPTRPVPASNQAQANSPSRTTAAKGVNPTLANAAQPPAQMGNSGKPPASEAARPTVEETRNEPGERPILIFDEEVDFDKEGHQHEEEQVAGLDDFDDLNISLDLAARDLSTAKTRISSLRELRGATVASTSRIEALRNVVADQISEQQLYALIEGIWGISSLKKLKIDQVEELITWGTKEDYFTQQVEAVLQVLEEERYF